MGRSWTEKEDALLRKEVAALSCEECLKMFRSDCACGVFAKKSTWDDVASRVPGRSSGSCQGRWNSVLDPFLQEDEWTPSEEERLLRLFKEKGTDTWQKRARALSSGGKRRSGAHVASKYFKLQKKKKRKV